MSLPCGALSLLIATTLSLTVLKEFLMVLQQASDFYSQEKGSTSAKASKVDETKVSKLF